MKGNPEKKNILLLTTDTGFGGAEKSFSALSVELEKKYNLYTVFFNMDQKPFYPIGGVIINLNTKSASFFTGSLYNSIRRIYLLRKIKKKYGIRLSISFLEGADYINILSRYKDKIIISIRGSKIHDINIKGFFKFLRVKILIPYLYKKPDKIICISNGLRNELVEHFNIKKNKIEVIYNFIDLNKIRNAATQYLEYEIHNVFKNPVLINHGRLSKEKGHIFQLLILKKLLKYNENIKLLIIGDGPYKEHIKSFCKKLNLNYFSSDDIFSDSDKYNVYFLGYTSNPFKYISRADIYLHTSFSEGFGNSLVEAMACQIPVVSTDCPYGPREIIQNAILIDDLKNYNDKSKIIHGILLTKPVKTPTTREINFWINTILFLLNNDLARITIGKNSLKRAQFFNKKKYLLKWYNVISKLLSE